jgi:predicted O-methyltransferase YrrM
MTLSLHNDPLNRYAEKYTTDEGPVLKALERQTHLKVEQSVMLSGKLQGMFLQSISKLVAPQLVLEIGTYTGYSAICLAAGLQPGGKLHTIDVNAELEDLALKFFAEAGLKEQIQLHVGNALHIIPTIEGQFDLVFIDADKVNYSNYFDLVIDRVRPGGVILADNVLFEGQVLWAEADQGKNARAMHAFNQKIALDNRVEHVLLPVRDGLMFIRKR